ncbi:hypothetical protein BgiBS90_010762 [Biomphalaria glabrata]|nr:hypothetical protein BgiMline_022990 [Biomphalaria glabrata]KAI8788094.1 hypothetical protein BgiBS90_010762 [Biomphalaria glabrata]
MPGGGGVEREVDRDTSALTRGLKGRGGPWSDLGTESGLSFLGSGPRKKYEVTLTSGLLSPANGDLIGGQVDIRLAIDD